MLSFSVPTNLSTVIPYLRWLEEALVEVLRCVLYVYKLWLCVVEM